MDALGDRLVHLLAGDLVRLETAELGVTVEVVANEQVGPTGAPNGSIGRHEVRFMPIGEDATSVRADRYQVVIDHGEDTDHVVGPLVAEVFDEDALAYESRPQGELTALEFLDSPG